MSEMSNPVKIKVLFCLIIGLVLAALLLNVLLLVDVRLIRYFKWVNAFTGFALVSVPFLTWVAKKQLDKQKTAFIHKIFSKN